MKNPFSRRQRVDTYDSLGPELRRKARRSNTIRSLLAFSGILIGTHAAPALQEQSAEVAPIAAEAGAGILAVSALSVGERFRFRRTVEKTLSERIGRDVSAPKPDIASIAADFGLTALCTTAGAIGGLFLEQAIQGVGTPQDTAGLRTFVALAVTETQVGFPIGASKNYDLINWALNGPYAYHEALQPPTPELQATQ